MTELLQAAQAALHGADWATARARYEACLAQEPNSAAAWEGLGSACYWLQDVSCLFEARQQAYQRYRAQGDPRSAARVAVWLAADYQEFRGEPVVAGGWLERARQLLEGVERSIEHAWLRVIEGHLALAVENDPHHARAAAGEALEIAISLGDMEHEILARASEGLALVAAGEVAEGMRRLDAAAAAALGGDMINLHVMGVACCSVIQACERVRDFERASQWSTRFQELCARLGLGKFLTFCRIQHGTVLLWRGEWKEAEVQLLAARRDLEAVRPASQAAALVRLGELRRRQGRWDEAGAFLEQGRTHRLATISSSALALDQGDTAAAEDLADQALRRFPTTDAARVSALELLVRARAARGALEEAGSALAELDALASRIGTPAVRAVALYAAGILARAREAPENARRALQDAADLFEAARCPFEAAITRLELADVLRVLGRAKPADTQARAALEGFTQLGATPRAERARQLLGDRPDARRGADGLTGRQRDVLRLVAQGLGNREIAARLSLSEFTVRRHLANIYTRLGVTSRAAAVAHALRDRLV